MKRRARTDNEKLIRKEAIMSAAMKCLDLEKHELPTLQKIGDKVGFVKSTMYLYFSSKEELYMEVLLRALKDLTATTLPSLKAGDSEAFAKAYVKFCANNPRAMFLCSLLPLLLENRAPRSVVLAFKIKVSLVLRTIAETTSVALGIPLRQAEKMHLSIYASAVGLWAHCHPPKVVLRMYELPHIANMKLDYADALSASIGALLHFYMKNRQGDQYEIT